MRISLIDKFTNLTQRIAARSHAAKPLNQARFKHQQGATAIEYAIIAGVVAVVIIAVFTGTDGLEDIFGGVFEKISGVLSDSTDGESGGD
ncbi:Flp family type IVb pilin [Chromohalobacter canadensis]|uniref:Flp family type IVb pilin n=1 Tax=Chromohalobacter canadensis TaxID=141389 RepID=UPI00240FA125|nr:Flp family type IVb pilin [Chromohalobacter canadensis]